MAAGNCDYSLLVSVVRTRNLFAHRVGDHVTDAGSRMPLQDFEYWECRTPETAMPMQCLSKCLGCPRSLALVGRALSNDAQLSSPFSCIC